MLDPSSSSSSTHVSAITNEVHERDILILYATETGTALDAAEQIAREALRRLFSVRLCSVDEYPTVRLTSLNTFYKVTYQMQRKTLYMSHS